MVTVRKLFITLLLTFCFSLSAESAEVRVHHRNLDNVRYLIYDDGIRRISSKELLIFHQTFTQAVRHVFHRYNERMPSSFTVSLSTGAWIFRYHTGFGSETAGLFHSPSKRFFFQNPAALRKKNILERVIYHEMMHCLIHRARRGKEIPQYRWLEESYCEAVFPARSAYTASPVPDFKKFKNFRAFKEFLRKNLAGKSTSRRRQAYSCAAAYGRKLIQMSSERRVLGMLIDGRGAAILEKAFLQLKK